MFFVNESNHLNESAKITTKFPRNKITESHTAINVMGFIVNEQVWGDKNLSFLIKNLFNKSRTLSPKEKKRKYENSFSIVFFYLEIYWTFMHMCDKCCGDMKLLKNSWGCWETKHLNQGMIVHVSRSDKSRHMFKRWSYEMCGKQGCS